MKAVCATENILFGLVENNSEKKSIKAGRLHVMKIDVLNGKAGTIEVTQPEDSIEVPRNAYNC